MPASRSIHPLALWIRSWLVTIKDDAELPPAVRARAASDLLAKQMQARLLILSGETLEALAQRLAEVEEALAASKG